MSSARPRYLVLGATGHVGSAVASALLARGEAVTIVAHDPDKAAAWKSRGTEVAIADVGDSAALRKVFKRADRAFLVNPPAPPTSDTDAEEHRTARSIVSALRDSGLEYVVAESTYGAQPGEQLGDLSVLYDFEQALRAQSIPAGIIRAAYYLSNWDAPAPAVLKTGTLTTMYPAQVQIPMVAPQDVGPVAARLLCGPVQAGITYVEGPARHTSADVTAAFGEALGRPVALEVIPREGWEDAFMKLGFSPVAAHAYARMTAVSVETRYALPQRFERGQVTLQWYIHELCLRATSAQR